MNFLQSDWSHTPKLDYATNKEVANYFGANAKWYRIDRFKGFINMGEFLLPQEVADRLKTDTVYIGIDYYGMLGVSRQLIPNNILKALDYQNGKVLYTQMYIKDNKLYWHKYIH